MHCVEFEKLVFLYIGFAWKLCLEVKRKEAIQSLEALLLEIGLHGGNVNITKDLEKSTNGKEDRKSTRLNSSHSGESRMPSSA